MRLQRQNLYQKVILPPTQKISKSEPHIQAYPPHLKEARKSRFQTLYIQTKLHPPIMHDWNKTDTPLHYNSILFYYANPVAHLPSTTHLFQPNSTQEIQILSSSITWWFDSYSCTPVFDTLTDVMMIHLELLSSSAYWAKLEDSLNNHHQDSSVYSLRQDYSSHWFLNGTTRNGYQNEENTTSILK